MTSMPATTRSRVVGSWVYLAVALLVAAMTLYVLFVPVDASDFERTTGGDWDAFSAANPAVADYLTREARLLAIGFLGLGLMATAVGRALSRSGDSWIVRAAWVLPVALVAGALVFFGGDGATLGAFYLALGVIAGAALAAAGRGNGRSTGTP